MVAEERPSRKKQWRNALSADLSLQVLEIFVKSGHCTIPTLGTLKQSSKLVDQLLESQEIWASIFHHRHSKLQIPDEAIEARGYKYLVRSLYNSESVYSTKPKLGRPPYSASDFVFVCQLHKHENEDEAYHLFSQWSAKGEHLPTTLFEECYGEIMLPEPVVVSDIQVFPPWVDDLILTINILRLTDMKMCCALRSSITRWIRATRMNSFADMRTHATGEHLMEYDDGETGRLMLWGFKPLPILPEVPPDIACRLSHNVHVNARLIFGENLDGKLAIKGVDLDLMKEPKPCGLCLFCGSRRAAYSDETEIGSEGVTPLHLFSYLHFL